MFPNTMVVSGAVRKVTSLETDPVNGEQIINVDDAIMENIDEPEASADDEEHVFDTFFNTAEKFPENADYVRLDPLLGSYEIIKNAEPESPQPDSASTHSDNTDDESENDVSNNCTLSTRVLTTVEKIDVQVNKLGKQMKSLRNANARRRVWQNRINVVLSAIVKGLSD